MTIVQERPATGPAAARRAMIDSQLRTSGVNAEWVLQRMNDVERAAFVPDGVRGHAYIDRAIPLGDGRFLPAPVFHGMMLQEARPTSADRALVVDAGSGYLAELVRPLVGSIEVVGPREALAGRGAAGFTLLLIEGAVEQIPEALVERLSADARIIAGLNASGITCLAVGRKSGSAAALLPIIEMGIPILHEFDQPKAWSF